MKVKNLHKLKYWNNYYVQNKMIAIKSNAGIFTSYDIFLCDKILQKYLPKYYCVDKTCPKICEVGSGNGKLLVKLAIMFGCKPYGIEYSKDVALKSKQIGVNTIVSDVFSESIMKKYRNFFDIVFSYGFVEHIIPPSKAVKLHIDLTKPGGYFVIQIPRFKGFNWWRINFFRPDLIPGHNMTIMEANILEKLCTYPNVEKIFCGNYGTYKLRIPMDKSNYKYYLLKTFCYVEYLLNPILRLLFGSNGFETTFFSPAVMFIGRKYDIDHKKTEHMLQQ